MLYQSLDDFLRDLPYHAAKNADKLRGHSALFLVETKQGRSLYVRLADGAVTTEAQTGDQPDCTVTADERTLLELINGKTNPVTALLLRRIVIKGDPAKLMSLIALL